MKLKRPNDCHGCRALYHNGFTFSCLLCFRLEEMRTDKRSAGVKIWIAVPAEPCYKPRTWKEYGEAAGIECSPAAKE